MQEILPRFGPAGVISPAVLGELSRRSPSEFDVQSLRPARNGLAGLSSGPRLRNSVVASGALRNTSATTPVSATAAIELRSFAETQIFPASSSAIPSAPSSSGCATRIFSRHSVLAVKVVSQPLLLRTAPVLVKRTFQIAPRAVSATSRSPSLVNA